MTVLLTMIIVVLLIVIVNRQIALKRLRYVAACNVRFHWSGDLGVLTVSGKIITVDEAYAKLIVPKDSHRYSTVDRMQKEALLVIEDLPGSQ